jgi:MFS family permease
LIFSLYGGVAADRISRRTLMVITQTAMLVLAFLLAGLVFTNVAQPWMIVVLAFLLGVANAFDAPARMAIIVDLVDDRADLTNAIALNATMFHLAFIVGPAVAGFTYAWLGPGWCFAFNGFSFIAVIIALLLMKIKPIPHSARNNSAMMEIKDSLSYVSSNRVVLILIASLGVFSVFAFGVLSLTPVWAVKVMNGDVTTNGFLLSARGVGALIGALTVAALGARRIRGKMWTLGSFLLPILLFLFAITPWLGLSLSILVGIGWGLMMIINNTNALIQTSIPDVMRGRVMALYSLVFEGGIPLGALLLGALASIIDVRLTVALCGIVLILFAVFTWFTNPDLRKLE